MITSFEVGAVFKILDEASPTLRKVLGQVRGINEAIEKTKVNLSGPLSSIGASLDPAIEQTRALAVEWRSVSRAASGATRSLTNTARAGVEAAVSLPAVSQALADIQAVTPARVTRRAPRALPGGGGTGGGHGGGSGFGVSAFGAKLPGSHAHLRFGSNAAMIAAGALGYGIYEDNIALENASAAVIAAEQPVVNRAMTGPSRQLSATVEAIKRVARASGFSISDASNIVRQDVLGLAGVPFNQRLASTAYLGRFAWAEHLLKHLDPAESDKALIGLMHMWGAYTPSQMRGLGNELVGLSTLSFSNLEQTEKTASYIAPTARMLDIPRQEVLAYIAASQRAGVGSSKAGTWFNDLILNGLNPKGGLAALLSSKAGQRRYSALRELGLVGANGEMTGLELLQHNELAQFSQILRDSLAKLDPTKRAGTLYEALGSIRAVRAAGLLVDPNFIRGVQMGEGAMDKAVGAGGVGQLQDNIMSVVPGFAAKRGLSQLNSILMDLGNQAIPPVVFALKDLDSVLKVIRTHLPGGPASSAWATVGGRALEFGAIGAGIGTFVPGVGTLVGAGIGGALGAAEGYMESLSEGKAKTQQFSSAVSQSGDSATKAASQVVQFTNALRGIATGLPLIGKPGGLMQKEMYVPSPGGGAPIVHHTSIMLDRHKVGDAVTELIVDRSRRAAEGSAYHDGTWSAEPSDMAYSI